MSGPIDPIRRTLRPQRLDGARAHDGDDGENLPPPHGFEANLPMVVEQPPPKDRRRPASTPRSDAGGTAPFAAQLLGQPGIKRGLRVGAETLGTARSTYLENEYSGPNDRRPAKGRITKTEI